ncbi:MAG TPA: TetR/AcrR family transcriptional regulator [Devosiaceae bacterium]|jgi:AcrR family transcriptional regulator
MAGRGRPRNFDRMEVLDRALHTFWRSGFEATSMNDLVDAMGIVSPSIYAAFGSKEALFAEAVQHYRAAYAAGLLQALNDAPDAQSGVNAMLNAAIDLFTRKDTPGGCFVVSATASNCPHNADMRKTMVQLRCERSDQIAARLRADVAAGRLLSDIPVATLADLFATVLQGLAIGARDGMSKARLRAMLLPARSMLAGWDKRDRR